ncbi:MAG: TIGR01906 family membrane protein [Caldisericota bacterium]|nr:TIGR01906 family membrane protein [Caldisericota bacterium]
MKFLKFVGIISIAIIIILASFFSLLFSRHFYSYEFEKQNISSSSELSNFQYVSYSSQIVQYFFRKGTLYITDENGNVIENFFSRKEIIHMQDVKNVMQMALSILFALFIVSFILILLLKSRKILFQRAAVGNLIFVLFISTMIVMNFNGTFTLFHKILFRNDFWLLPENAVLIRMFPESFFVDFALFWGAIVAVISASIIFLDIWLEKIFQK